jgi:hypothetical protein
VLILLLLVLGLAGCVRIGGSAGYWKQGADDETPEIHQTGFDTATLVPAKLKS